MKRIFIHVSLWLMYEGRHFVFGVIDPKCERDCVCCTDRVCRQGFNFPNVCTIGCIDGHRGVRCYELCENNCKTCPDATTLCKSCYDQFYLSPDKQCRSCPVNCQTCTSNTRCTLCKEGFENGDGSVCEYSICLDNCICDNSSCISCKNGYYDVTSSCSGLCPSRCLTCRSLTECHDCIEGYYNGYNDNRILLNNCTHKCRETCKVCSSYDQCQQCQTGKYGNICQYNCSVGCMDNTCVQVSGECKCRSNFIGEKCAKCITGNYGNYCNKQCPKYCKNNECDKVSGECTQGCATTDFIGFKCENCTSGKYGEHCSLSCPVNCDNEICDRTSGDCTDGCKETQEKKDAPNTALVATAAVLGSFLSLSLAGYLVLLAIFVMKRIKISRRKHSPSRREPTYENQLENIGGQVPRTILATDTLDSGTVERNIYEGVSRVNEQEHEYQQVSHDHGMSSSRRTDTDEEIRVQMKT